MHNIGLSHYRAWPPAKQYDRAVQTMVDGRGFMRWDRIYCAWTQRKEALRKKWTVFVDGLLWDLAVEEMKIRREELEKQIGSQKPGRVNAK